MCHSRRIALKSLVSTQDPCGINVALGWSSEGEMGKAARALRLFDESWLGRGQLERPDAAAPTVGGRNPGPTGGENQLLAQLPSEVVARLAPYFDRVQFERQHVLFRAQEPLTAVYFPDTAVVSLVSRLESGQALEVGLVGRDGIVGTPLLSGVPTTTYDATVLVPGSARRVSADVLRRELLANISAYGVIERFVHVLLVRSMQLSVCNALHEIEPRCVRWLLTVDDLTAGREIPLTHEELATILGVRRPTVTLVLGSLQRAGLIRESRGRIVIKDRSRLEGASCECYRLMRDEQRRLLGY
jgi:CRP-like cAMP-binding protein